MEKLYVNENFPLPVVLLLRNLGYDVLTSMDAGNANQRIPDDDVLKFSTSQNRILITLNRRDFIQLHRINPVHSGIIVCTEDADFTALANRIHVALLTNKNQFTDQLIRVYRPA
jgi:predicted nuclease of predicted toxin-antitoxin system